MTYSFQTIKSDLKEIHCLPGSPSFCYLCSPVLNWDCILFPGISPKVKAIDRDSVLHFNSCFIRMQTDMPGHWDNIDWYMYRCSHGLTDGKAYWKETDMSLAWKQLRHRRSKACFWVSLYQKHKENSSWTVFRLLFFFLLSGEGRIEQKSQFLLRNKEEKISSHLMKNLHIYSKDIP